MTETQEKAAVLEVGWIQVALEISIDAPVARVWQALTAETGAWWHPHFWLTPAPRRMIFEPFAGGRVYEKGADGTELLWYTVSYIQPPLALNLSGHIAPPWSGPATSLLRLDLEADGEGRTRLKLLDSIFGQVNENLKKGTTDGWMALFSDGLKAYVEKSLVA